MTTKKDWGFGPVTGRLPRMREVLGSEVDNDSIHLMGISLSRARVHNIVAVSLM